MTESYKNFLTIQGRKSRLIKKGAEAPLTSNQASSVAAPLTL